VVLPAPASALHNRSHKPPLNLAFRAPVRHYAEILGLSTIVNPVFRKSAAGNADSAIRWHFRRCSPSRTTGKPLSQVHQSVLRGPHRGMGEGEHPACLLASSLFPPCPHGEPPRFGPPLTGRGKSLRMPHNQRPWCADRMSPILFVRLRRWGRGRNCRLCP
jgi:hypothetical protein